MVIVFKIGKKCSQCKKNYKLVDYRNGDKILKTCIKCRNSKIKSRDKCRCIHDRIKYYCKDCNGSSFCQHNKRKSTCKDCNGSEICQHNIRRAECKICNDPIDITIKMMIKGSKKKDKKYNRYDELNFIDYLFVKNLINSCNDKCYYCQCDLQYTYYNNTLGTIERLDNTLGHIKSNCVIACRTCNVSKVGDRINFQE